MSRARATIRIDLSDADAEPTAITGAIAPDDTAQMTSRLRGEKLETRVERDSVGGLRSTIDDYVVNLRVAKRVAAIATRGHDADDERDDRERDDGERNDRERDDERES